MWRGLFSSLGKNIIRKIWMNYDLKCEVLLTCLVYLVIGRWLGAISLFGVRNRQLFWFISFSSQTKSPRVLESWSGLLFTIYRPDLIRDRRDWDKRNTKPSAQTGYKRSPGDTFYTEESLNCSSSFPHRKHGNTKILSFIKRSTKFSPLPIIRLLNTWVKLKKMTKLYNYHYTGIYTSLLYWD